MITPAVLKEAPDPTPVTIAWEGTHWYLYFNHAQPLAWEQEFHNLLPAILLIYHGHAEKVLTIYQNTSIQGAWWDCRKELDHLNIVSRTHLYPPVKSSAEDKKSSLMDEL